MYKSFTFPLPCGRESLQPPQGKRTHFPILHFPDQIGASLTPDHIGPGGMRKGPGSTGAGKRAAFQ